MMHYLESEYYSIEPIEESAPVPVPSPLATQAPVLGFVSDTPDQFYGAAMRYYGRR